MPSVWCADPDRASVSGHADGERSVPYARRHITGRATGRGSWHVEARSAIDRDDRAAPQDHSRDAEDTPRNAGVGASLAAEHRITGCSTEANNSALMHASVAGIATIVSISHAGVN